MLAAASAVAEFPKFLDKIFVNKQKNIVGIN
jgi:hypothetical protein